MLLFCYILILARRNLIETKQLSGDRLDTKNPRYTEIKSGTVHIQYKFTKMILIYNSFSNSFWVNEIHAMYNDEFKLNYHNYILTIFYF